MAAKKDKIVLVTGATGKVGQTFIRRFLQDPTWEGAVVRAFCHNRLLNEHERLQVVRVDQDGADKIYQAQKRFIEDVLSIREKNLSQGSKVMFVATLYNSLGKS